MSLPRSERVVSLGQGRALPTELLSQFLFQLLIVNYQSLIECCFSLKAGAKIRSFFEFTKFFDRKKHGYLHYILEKKREQKILSTLLIIL